MVIVSGIVFGVMPSIITFCYSQGASKLLVLFFRYFVLSIVLMPIALRHKNTLQLYKKNWWKLLIISSAGICTALLLYSAYTLLPTGVVTTIHFLYPTVVALLCVFVFHEKLSKLNLLCLTLSVSGILLIFDMTGQKLDILGIIIAACSSLTWATYIVLLNKLPFEGVSSEQLIWCVSINGIFLTLIYALLTGGLRVSVSPIGWAAVVGSSILIAVFGSMFFAIGVQQTDAQVSAIASTLEPITSILVGVLFLNESITLRTAIGSALIFLAIILLAVYRTKPAEKN